MIDNYLYPMAMRVVQPLILLLPLVACSGAECLSLPCPQPVAISLTISSTVAGSGGLAAAVDVSGPVQSSFSCGATCPVFGTAGAYHITVRAPGFAPIERSVQVRGTNPPCGCATTVVENVMITLSTPATSVLGPQRAARAAFPRPARPNRFKY